MKRLFKGEAYRPYRFRYCTKFKILCPFCPSNKHYTQAVLKFLKLR
ncbi:MAG: hypothetical protein LBJ00_17315 [Planctomycetaceae bacterium]|nr:hypothetical protein [Planctomycetaceae bacterium]